jgi:branched-subunit amino acid transport protein
MATSFLLTVLCCAIVTISVRTLPLLLLANRELPNALREWLNFIPSSIMTAIIATELLSKPDYSKTGWSISLLSAFACLLIGLLTRSLFLTVLTGIGAYICFGRILS